ncbi:MAG: BamA/TamA family outer membrane protein [Deltaproteobacteria bacterium]|nr:BamA/TamA family outer membrane protein [Deltaproteobacteria bacterium]
MLATVLTTALTLVAQPPTPAPLPVVAPPEEGSWDFAAVPRLTLSTDDGVGLGARGVAYWNRFGQKPYKTALSAQAWATTRLVQHHYLHLDAIDAFNLPLRVEADVQLYSAIAQPFCDDDPMAPCADDRAHTLRSIEPAAAALARWRVVDAPHKLELFAGTRATWYVPGTLLDDDGDGAPDLVPTPDTRYAARYPQGEPGLAHVLSVGVAYDTRDHEPAPHAGLHVDAAVRGASPWWGSAFSFVGATLTARSYTPLLPSRGVVLAERLIVDVVAGDAPTRERQRVGGLVELPALGGQELGRGVRLARFATPLKIVTQHELRSDLAQIDVLGKELALVAVGFVDAGVALWRFDREAALVLGLGTGLRVEWNHTFVMRLDLAMSPLEPGRLAAYSAPGHPY